MIRWHHIHIRRLYIDVMPNGLLLHWLLLVLRDGIVLLLMVMLLMVMVATAPTIPAMVRGRSRMGGHAILIPTTTSPSSMGIMMVRTSTCKDLIQVIVFERLPLQHEVGESSTNLAQDSATTSRITNASTILV